MNIDKNYSEQETRRKIRSLVNTLNEYDRRLRKLLDKDYVDKVLKEVNKTDMNLKEFTPFVNGFKKDVENVEKHSSNPKKSQMGSMLKGLRQMLKFLSPLLKLMKIPMPPQLMLALTVISMILEIFGAILDRLEKSPKSSMQKNK